MQVSNPFSRPANQDRKRFPLGTSDARPATGYFAAAAGLASEKVISDAICGLSNEQEIEDALCKLLGRHSLALGYMKWRMGIRR